MKFRVLHGFHAQKDDEGITRMYGPNDVVETDVDLCAKFNAGAGAVKFEALEDDVKRSEGRRLTGHGEDTSRNPRTGVESISPGPVKPSRAPAPTQDHERAEGRAHTETRGPAHKAAEPHHGGPTSAHSGEAHAVSGVSKTEGPGHKSETTGHKSEGAIHATPDGGGVPPGSEPAVVKSGDDKSSSGKKGK